VAQLVLQAVAPQMKGAQLVSVGIAQLPFEHSAAVACWPPEQLGDEH
jgi:hypothetical protein